MYGAPKPFQWRSVVIFCFAFWRNILPFLRPLRVSLSPVARGNESGY